RLGQECAIAGRRFRETSSRSVFLREHDLFRKPAPTFRDHALSRSVGAGGHAHARLEDAVEVALVEKSAGCRDGARRLAALEPAPRGAKAAVDLVGVGREPGLAAKGADQMRAGEAGEPGELVEL